MKNIQHSTSTLNATAEVLRFVCELGVFADFAPHELVSNHPDFGCAFLAVFGEATLSAPRHLLGAQIDLLPALMVYAALNADLVDRCRCSPCWADCGSTRFRPIRSA